MRKYLTILFLLVSLASQATVYQIADQTAFNAFDFTSLVAGDNVQLQKGQIFYGTITISDSGTAGNLITFGSYGTGTDPIITGFTTITSGWTDEGGGIYSKVITSEAQTNMVTIDGIPYGMGRYPNTTFLTFESASSNVSITDNQLTGTPDWTNAEAVIYKNDYVIDRTLITNHTTTTLTYTTLGTTSVAEAVGNYFFQNDLKTLDSYGEWYHDYSGTGKFYMFFGAVDPTTKTVKVSTLNNLLKSSASQDYITIDGISFTGAIRQAIIFQSANDYISIQNCSISFTGRDGIYISGANPTVNNSILNYCGRIGVYSIGVNSTVTNNTISNNAIIIGQGNYGTSGLSAIVVTNDNATVTGNNIQNTATNGIFVHENVDVGLIKNNYIYNTCLLNWDHGSIYCSGLRTALVIEGNIINKSFGSGVYLDATSSNIEVKNNTVTDCVLNGIFIHRSHDIIVTGNTSYNNDTQFLLLNFINENLMYNITASNNIFISKAATQKTLWYQTIYTGYAATLSTYSFSDNIYARPINDNTTIYSVALGIGGNKTLAEWKTFSGTDANSITSPYTIEAENELLLIYNPTTSDSIVSLPNKYKDLNGTSTYTVTLQPYTSKILFRDFSESNLVRPIMKNGKYLRSRSGKIIMTR